MIQQVCFLIPRMIEGGVKLEIVMKEIESYERLAVTHAHMVFATYMKWYKDW